MTDRYLIGRILPNGGIMSPAGGGSHSFIASLTMLLCTHSTEVLRFDDAHSHDPIMEYANKNYTFFSMNGATPGEMAPGSTNPYIWKAIRPMRRMSAQESWDYFEDSCPGFKFINISYTADDALLIAANHVYKMYIYLEESSPDHQRIFKLYLDEAERNPKVRQGLTHIRELTTDEMREVLINQADSEYNRYVLTVQGSANPPDYMRDRTCTIPFRDIYHDMNSVLRTLSKITGEEITPNVRSSYRAYIDAQNKFYTRYRLPWIHPK